jgi:peptidyl-tRNA hydrolase, PTH1 family
MFFVIGLGNPEKRYNGTRHNVGFDVVDALAATLRLQFSPGKGEFLISEGKYRDQPLALVKPVTYMNESGIAAMNILEQYDSNARDMLIVCDDFQLPLGQLRLRPRGSDGGHNGLSSIIYHLQTDEVPRIRCGIGSPMMPAEKSRMADFVLERFAPDELPVVRQMIATAADACLCVLTEGVTKAMNIYNQKSVSENDTLTQ